MQFLFFKKARLFKISFEYSENIFTFNKTKIFMWGHREEQFVYFSFPRNSHF
jgi:hypothetical protein